MSRELLPCPFCGGPGALEFSSGSWGYSPPSVHCECFKCHIRTAGSPISEYAHDRYPIKAEAAEIAANNWNTRAPVSVTNDPRVVALVEASRAYADAEEALANREYMGINAESHEKLQPRVHAARRDLEAALANLEKKEC